jgi:ATP-dependent DNA helicase RecQ
LTIDRLEQDNRKKYTKDDYEKLNQFYEQKVQQIHIVGEYAKKMIDDYRSALQFVDDYFQLNYSSFLNRYFPGSKADTLKMKMTPTKFRQLFGELSPTQLSIINDNESKYIAVAAGPGSGKTRVLVHKLASLLLMEDVKHEQLLMLTFSRAAVTEFKKRLYKLIGNAAYFVDIKTLHSFCFDLMGKVGSLEKSDDILKRTIQKIRDNEVEISHITKTVLVIDEAQDMNEDEYNLICTLMELNEEMRVIAVGDDDQNIYEFRGSSSKYLESFISNNKATRHELLENYRSKNNLVEYTNEFSKQIKHRLKSTDIFARQRDNGSLKVVRYYTNNLIIPLVNDILFTGLSGTTCVLTKTNEEALQVAGLLLKNNVQAKLIQSNDGFSLYHVLEIRCFIQLLNLTDDMFVISDDAWDTAKKELTNLFRKSSRLDMCLNLIRDFEDCNPKKKYKSDFETFVRESKLEDFYNENGDTVFVSTIHKAKGKEFDNVFMMLDNFNAETDEAKRVLYVGMTRAKKNLTIHLNSHILDTTSRVLVDRIENKSVYLTPNGISMHLSHRDVNLGYFEYVQNRIRNIISGDALIIKEEGCANSNGDLVLKFSQKTVEALKYHADKGYQLKEAKVNFVVYWRKEGSDNEIKIVLPELYLEKD